MADLHGVARNPRRYAIRLLAGEARRSTITVRVTLGMKEGVALLAARRGISLCEYAARVINDHLASAQPASFWTKD